MARGGFNGFPGGGGRNNMMKQIEKLQKQMEEMQENLANEEISATAGGGDAFHDDHAAADEAGR